MSKLFDIAQCKCLNFRTCTCDDSKKIPVNKQHFIVDQRKARRIILNFPQSEVESTSLMMAQISFKLRSLPTGVTFQIMLQPKLLMQRLLMQV